MPEPLTTTQARTTLEAHVDRCQKAPNQDQDELLVQLFFSDNPAWCEVMRLRKFLPAHILAVRALVEWRCSEGCEAMPEVFDCYWCKPQRAALIAVAEALVAGGAK